MLNMSRRAAVFLLVSAFFLCLYLCLVPPKDSVVLTNKIKNTYVLVMGSPDGETSLRFEAQMMTLKTQTLRESTLLADKQYNPAFIRAYHGEGLLVIGNMAHRGQFEGRYLWMNKPSQVNTFNLTLCDSCPHLGSYL